MLTADVKRAVVLLAVGLAMYALAFFSNPAAIPRMLYLVAGTLFEIAAIIILVRGRASNG